MSGLQDRMWQIMSGLQNRMWQIMSGLKYSVTVQGIEIHNWHLKWQQVDWVVTFSDEHKFQAGPNVAKHF